MKDQILREIITEEFGSQEELSRMMSNITADFSRRFPACECNFHYHPDSRCLADEEERKAYCPGSEGMRADQCKYLMRGE